MYFQLGQRVSNEIEKQNKVSFGDVNRSCQCFKCSVKKTYWVEALTAKGALEKDEANESQNCVMASHK